MKSFRRYEPDQLLLMPASHEDSVLGDHLAE